MRPPWILAGIGLIALGVGVGSGLRRAPGPGKLIPEETRLVVGPAGSANQAEGGLIARFQVHNRGGEIVHVLDVESGCGCARPEVEPRTVAPGGTATVTVRADPLEVGERPVAITLKTDSTATPEVALQVHVIGNRKPPYLLRADGELFYRWNEDLVDSTREILVNTIEHRRRSESPRLRSDLSFLSFDEPTMTTERPHASDPDIVGRTYRFLTRIASPAVSTPFQGQVEVIDPWDSRRVLSIMVRGEEQAELRASPERLILTLSGPDDHATDAKLLVRTRGQSHEVRITPDPADSPLRVEALPRSQAEQYAIFEVSLKPEAQAREGIYKLVARTGEPRSAEVVIPVLVRPGGG